MSTATLEYSYSTHTHETNMAGKEEKYESFMLTPEGSIISMMDKELKPESDPEWEAHKRARTEAMDVATNM